MKLKRNKLFMFILLILCSTINIFAFNNCLTYTGDSRVNDSGAYVTSTQLFSYLTTQSYNSYFSTSYTEENTGISGSCLSNYSSCSTKDPLVERMDTAITDQNCKYVFILSPINDIKDIILTPVDDYKTAYEYLLDNVTAENPTSFIVLMNNPDLSNNSNYNSASSIALNNGVNELVYNLSVEYETLFFNMGDFLNSTLAANTIDGIHYNVAGHSTIADELEKVYKAPQNYSQTNRTYNNIVLTINASSSNNTYNIRDTNVWGSQFTDYSGNYTSTIDVGSILGVS